MRRPAAAAPVAAAAAALLCAAPGIRAATGGRRRTARQSGPPPPPEAPPRRPPLRNEDLCRLAGEAEEAGDQDWVHMLRGYTLSVGAAEFKPYVFDRGDGEDTHYDPRAASLTMTRFDGRDVRIAMELAKAGDFSIDFVPSSTPELAAGGANMTDLTADGDLTYDDVLRHDTARFDFLASYYLDLARRRKFGIVFSTPYHDGDLVLVVPAKVNKQADLWNKAFFWLQPFTGWAWAVIAGMLIFTSIIVWMVERPHKVCCEPDEHAQAVKEQKESEVSFLDVLQNGWLMALGFGNFGRPSGMFPRLILITRSISAFVIFNAYAANLTTFLVKTRPSLPVESFEQFLSKNHTACVIRGSPVRQHMQQLFPALTIVDVARADIFDVAAGLRDEHGVTCGGAIVTQTDAELGLLGTWGGRKWATPDVCNLRQVGRSSSNRMQVEPVDKLYGCLPFRSEGKCVWVMHRTLNTLIRTLNTVPDTASNERPFARDLIHEAHQRMIYEAMFLNGSQQAACGASTDIDSDDPERIDAASLTGLLVITIPPMLIFAAMAYVLRSSEVPRWCQTEEQKQMDDKKTKKARKEDEARQQKEEEQQRWLEQKKNFSGLQDHVRGMESRTERLEDLLRGFCAEAHAARNARDRAESPPLQTANDSTDSDCSRRKGKKVHASSASRSKKDAKDHGGKKAKKEKKDWVEPRFWNVDSAVSAAVLPKQ